MPSSRISADASAGANWTITCVVAPVPFPQNLVAYWNFNSVITNGQYVAGWRRWSLRIRRWQATVAC